MAAVSMGTRLLKIASYVVCTPRFRYSHLRSCNHLSTAVPGQEKQEKPLGVDEKNEDTIEVTESEAEKLLREENNKLLAQVAEFTDKYKRALAETENVRQRMQRQINEARQFGIQGFCKDLVSVADILCRATESVPQDQITDSNPHLKNLFEGLKLTEAELLRVFNRNGLEQINPIGEKFDPNLHEALFQQFVEGKDPGTIITVTTLGYTLHDRVIRAAIVGVAKAL